MKTKIKRLVERLENLHNNKPMFPSETITYEGNTLEELEASIRYIDKRLDEELEPWEFESYMEVRKAQTIGINSIIDREFDRKEKEIDSIKKDIEFLLETKDDDVIDFKITTLTSLVC